MDELFIATAASHMQTLKSPYDWSADIEYLGGILETNPGLIPHWKRFRRITELVSRETARSIDSRLNQIQSSRGDDGAA